MKRWFLEHRFYDYVGSTRNTQEQRSTGTRDVFYFHVQSKVHGNGDEPIPSLQRYMTHINMANNIDFCLPVHNYDFWGDGVFFGECIQMVSEWTQMFSHCICYCFVLAEQYPK